MPKHEAETEKLAIRLHDAYEDAAKRHGWKTQKKTRVKWDDLPESNKKTMLEAVGVVFETHIASSRQVRDALAMENRYRERSEDKLRYAEAKAQVMIEAFVALREIACRYVPAVVSSQGYTPLKKLLADDTAMEAAIQKVLKRP
jgi:hypothetical protein